MPISLRPYQIDLVQQVFQAWNEGYKNVLARSPTGSGKSVTLSEICRILSEDHNLPGAIEVHRKELVHQLSLTLSSFGIAHNIIAPRAVISGIIAAQRKEYGRQFYNYKALVTLVSVDTLLARMKLHEEWTKTIKWWIVDEAAHVLKNNKWGKTLELFPNAFGLGVTATPQRLDKRGLGEHADGVFHKMVHGPEVSWLIKNGFLSRYKIVVPESDYSQYLKKAQDGHDFTREAMADAAAKSHIVGDVVANYIKFAKGKQAIVFASDMNSAHRMETEFTEKGFNAKLLTGETPDKERLNAMNDYRACKIQVLINIDLFDEGLDVPGIEVVIMARPTMSLGKYLQICGRGLRVAKNKEYALIIDHVGNVKTHGLPDNKREWTLDRIVKRRDKVNLIRICKNFMCNSPFDRLAHQCPYCGWEDQPAQRGSSGGRIGPAQVDGDLVLMDPDTLRELEGQAMLEDPGVVAERVSKAAGGAAGVAAMKKQVERIETQKRLIESIALWAGRRRAEGLDDRMINKLFFARFDKTITQALGEPKADMLCTLEELGL